MSEAEAGFLLISEVVARLEAGMFGGNIRRPEPVEGIKKLDPRISVGFALQRQKAASIIYKAIMAGRLGVHVFASPGADGVCRVLQVPVNVLARLFKSRGGLPDHPIRLPFNLLRDNVVAPELFAALSSSAMFLQGTEFKGWYQRQKRQRRWPSQRESVKPRAGRPSKQTEKLLTSIRARAAENSWSASEGIAPLVKLLVAHGQPTRNTVRRAVDRLYEETGDPAYRIVPRKRAKAKPSGTQT
jgi:hypothetical protein